jgi:WD40 repeat protein
MACLAEGDTGMRSNRIRLITAWSAIACGSVASSLEVANLYADDVTTAIFVMKADGSGLRKLAQVEGYKKLNSPQWSHDGKRLAFNAIEGPDGAEKFFAIDADGGGLQELGENSMPHWSPDDKQLAYHNYGRGGLKRGVYVQNLDGKGRDWLADGYSPRWSPDGSHIAYISAQSLKVLDLVDGQIRAEANEAFDELYFGFDWSPDGKRLAFVGRRNGDRELVIADGQGLKVRLRGNLSGNVGWSPDGKRLAVGLNGSLHLVDPDETAAPELIPGQEGDNRGPAWSPDGQWLAFSSDRKTSGAPIKVALRRPLRLEEVVRHPKGTIVYGLAFTPDGRRVVMGGDPVNRGVQIWDLASGKVSNFSSQGILIAMSPGGRQFATAWLSGTIQLTNVDDGETVRELNHGNVPGTISYSKDGGQLLSGGLNDKVLHVWDVNTGDKVCTFSGHENWIARAAFLPDGKAAVSVSQDKTLRVWDAKTGIQKLSIAHPEPLYGLAISPDGRQFMTGTGGALVGNPLTLMMAEGGDNVLRLWNAADGKLVRELKGHTHAAFTVDISPDGRLAVSGGWDTTIRLWDLGSGEELHRIDGKGGVMQVAFSPDGKQVLVGGGVTRLANKRLAEIPDEQIRLFKIVEVPVGATTVE